MKNLADFRKTMETDVDLCLSLVPSTLGTLRYEDGEPGRRREWMRKTRSSPVVPVKKKILKSKQFSLGTATAIFLSQTNMSNL